MTTASKSILAIELEAEEAGRVREAFDGFSWGPDVPVLPAIDDARASFGRAMPGRVLDALNAMRTGTGPAVVVLGGLPFDPTIKTGPRDPMIAYPDKADRLSEGLALGAAAYQGDAYGIVDEGDGVVNNLSPTLADIERHTGNGSRRKLGLHIENAAPRRLPPGISPDGLVLLGISRDPIGNPPTMVADARLAYGDCSEATQLRLLEPVDIKVPERWRAGFPAAQVHAPVVSVTNGVADFAFAFYGDMTTASDLAGQLALAEFEAALEARATALRVLPGTMAIISNRVAAHGRGSFEAGFTADGLPFRWLQRVFWTQDIGRFEEFEEPTCRVYNPGRKR